MPRYLWSGTISFGLVAIPVGLTPAVRDAGPRFHMLHEKDNARLRRVMVCPDEGTAVHPEHIVRGFPVSDEEHVVVRESELEALSPERSRTIEILQLVDADEIDPMYYDRPYYVVPTDADKPYLLLARALEDTGKVGIAKFVMREGEYLVALRCIEKALCLQTMHYAEDLVDPDDLAPEGTRVPKKRLNAMKKAIGQLKGDFKAEDYPDEYRKRVEKLVKKKKKKEGTVEAPIPEEEEPETADLISALESSLEKARKKK
jgi:DNA end-binding protein Ku